MSQYLIEQIEPKQPGTNWNRDFRTQDKLVEEFSKEIDRLDPRDFAPAVQCEFVMLRAQVKAWSDYTMRVRFRNPFHRLAKVLEFYGGPDSWLKSRSFSYVTDDELRKIVERDYRELALSVLPAGAWKSAVILAGSILEALLFDALTRDSETVAKANTAHSAPRFKGKVQPIEEGNWRLSDLIDVAAELQVLSPERAKTIDQVLRDYRNFVHPNKEVRSKHACSEAEALLAKGALEGVCNHFETTAASPSSNIKSVNGNP